MKTMVLWPVMQIIIQSGQIAYVYLATSDLDWHTYCVGDNDHDE
jgi:hypothetical protein